VVARHGAGWTHDGTVNYAGSFGNEYAFRVTASVDAELGGSAPAFSLTSLARELAAANGQVDYVKMDVEGAEEQLLRSDDWSECVRAIKVEVHEPYTVDDCRSDLHRLGSLVRLDDACSTSVIGVRP
jgi:FkbM family methyltransferase